MRWKATAMAVMVAVGGFGATSADAGLIYGFQGVTNNDPFDTEIGEAQFFVEVSDLGGGIADFRFFNTGPEASSIASIYVDGDRLSGIQQIIDGPNVDFEPGGAPPDLPGGETIDFDADFNATAEPPRSHNGINPDEFTNLHMFYAGSFDDVIADLEDGTLRIGLHGIAFDSGGSESFVTPTPGALPVLLMGLVARRRRR